MRGFTAPSDWLADAKAEARDKRDGKWTWSGFDMTSANAPIDQQRSTSIPEPRKVGSESAGSWRSQLTVTTLSDRITHHAVWDAARLLRMMDRWQSSLALPLHSLTSSLGLVSANFVPILYFLKSVKLYCWQTCQTIIFSVSELWPT